MIYTFKNNETGEVFEKHMRMDDKDPYLEENPNLSLVITPIRFNYSSKGEVYSNVPDNFKDKLREIDKSHPDTIHGGSTKKNMKDSY